MIRPAVLVITDGIGYRKNIEGNAFAQAKKPEWERILASRPYAFLDGRGTPPVPGINYLKKIDDFIKDEELGKIYDSTMDKNGVMIITADHGNIEQIEDDNTDPVTEHTINPVYCIVAGNGIKKIHSGGLKDIAPTVLDIVDITLSPEMTGNTLTDG